MRLRIQGLGSCAGHIFRKQPTQKGALSNMLLDFHGLATNSVGSFLRNSDICVPS